VGIGRASECARARRRCSNCDYLNKVRGERGGALSHEGAQCKEGARRACNGEEEEEEAEVGREDKRGANQYSGW